MSRQPPAQKTRAQRRAEARRPAAQAVPAASPWRLVRRLRPVAWAAFDEGHIAAPQDGATGDSGSRTWLPGEVWRFFTQFQNSTASPGTSASAT